MPIASKLRPFSRTALAAPASRCNVPSTRAEVPIQRRRPRIDFSGREKQRSHLFAGKDSVQNVVFVSGPDDGGVSVRGRDASGLQLAGHPALAEAAAMVLGEGKDVFVK